MFGLRRTPGTGVAGTLGAMAVHAFPIFVKLPPHSGLGDGVGMGDAVPANKNRVCGSPLH